MKAIRIGGPGKVDLAEVPEPRDPGPGEVLLRVRRVGYCGSDLNSYRGSNPMVTYPRIPGHEIGAAIERAGSGVSSEWAPGRKVLVSPYSHCGRCSACRLGRSNACRENQTLGVQRDGAMCEWIVVPQETLFSSDRLDYGGLALVEPLTIGFHAVDRGAVSAADHVAVFGCGAVGLGAIAGATARGATAVGIDLDDKKLELARACGAGFTINTSRDPLSEALRELTAGEGPAVAVEAVGLPQTFRSCVEEVAFCGRVVYIGYARQPVEYETKSFVMKELDIRGSRNALPGDFQSVIKWLEGGRFPIHGVITKTVDVEDAPGALSAWDREPAHVTRIHVSLES